jgi:transcriptional regulator with GAF, ATPase, and Fis domain
VTARGVGAAPVLITGERGTGKELVARAIHEGSRRAKQEMEKLNCAAVPQELIESELFGHEAGAFTGAVKMRKGKFERAHGSTLFLDEVGDMPAAMQAKLLRVLQEGEVERVGGAQTSRSTCAWWPRPTATSRADVAAGRFRADLYDRLNVVPIRVPPLRARREDIPALVEHFLPASCEANDRAPKTAHPGRDQPPAALPLPGQRARAEEPRRPPGDLTEREVIDEDDVREALPPGASGPPAGRAAATGTTPPARP